jgi:hypothetical protein
MAIWPSFYGTQSSKMFDSHKKNLAVQSLMIPLIKWLHNFLDDFECMWVGRILLSLKSNRHLAYRRWIGFSRGGPGDVGYFSGYAEVNMPPSQTIQISHGIAEASNSIPMFQGVDQHGIAVGGNGWSLYLQANKKDHYFIQIDLSIRYSQWKEFLKSKLFIYF